MVQDLSTVSGLDAMRDKLLAALREAARHSHPELPGAARVAVLAGVDEADVRLHLGPPENFAALLAFQTPAHETRDRIIASAARVFARKGFQRATLDQVAADAGLTKGAIYWHFKSKNDLFFAMLDCRLRQDTAPLLVDLESLIRDGGEPLPALTAIFQAGIENCVDDPDWPALFLECVSLARDPDVRERLAAFYDELWALSRGFTQQLQAHGLSNPQVDPQVAAVFWTALFDGLMLAWTVKGEALDFRHLLPELFRMLWQGLAPGELGSAASVSSSSNKNAPGDAP